MNSPRDSLFVPVATHHPLVRPLLDLASAGRWRELAGRLNQMPSATGRSTAMAALADTAPEPKSREFDLDDELDRLLGVLRAHFLVVRAWDARSGRRAAEVSTDQFQQFRELLVEAERLLVDITASDRDCVDAWALRLTTSRGLGLGLAETRRRHNHVRRIDAHHHWAHAHLLQELCPKWHGDWDAAFTFAREVAASSPPGSLGHLLVVDAHLEKWAEEGPSYLTHQSVLNEVTACARQSVLHPACRWELDWSSAHSKLALLYSLAQRPGQALPHFEALGEQPVSSFWEYLEEPEQAYREWRYLAVQRGGMR